MVWWSASVVCLFNTTVQNPTEILLTLSAIIADLVILMSTKLSTHKHQNSIETVTTESVNQ